MIPADQGLGPLLYSCCRLSMTGSLGTCPLLSLRTAYVYPGPIGWHPQTRGARGTYGQNNPSLGVTHQKDGRRTFAVVTRWRSGQGRQIRRGPGTKPRRGTVPARNPESTGVASSAEGYAPVQPLNVHVPPRVSLPHGFDFSGPGLLVGPSDDPPVSANPLNP